MTRLLSAATICALLGAAQAATNTIRVCNAVPVAITMSANITDVSNTVLRSGELAYGACSTVTADFGTTTTPQSLSVTYGGGAVALPVTATAASTGDNIMLIRPSSATQGSLFYGATIVGLINPSADSYAVWMANACIGNGDITYTVKVGGQDITPSDSTVTFTDLGQQYPFMKAAASAGAYSFEATIPGMSAIAVGVGANGPFGKASVITCHGIKDDTTYPLAVTTFGEALPSGGAAGVSLTVATWATVLGLSALVSKRFQ